MSDLCENGSLYALTKYISSNNLYIGSWEKCFSLGLGLNGKDCPYDEINKELYCSKGSAEEFIAFLKNIMTECPEHSWDIEVAYYGERLNMINICSKDSVTGKECHNIPKVYETEPLKRFTFMKPIQWDSNLCKSSCGAEYDALYREFGNSTACSKFIDETICKSFQSGNSTCTEITEIKTPIKDFKYYIGGFLISFVVYSVLFSLIFGIMTAYKIKKKNKNKNNDNKDNDNTNDTTNTNTNTNDTPNDRNTYFY